MSLPSTLISLVWEGDFNQLVVDTYHRPYVFQQQEMAAQDTLHRFTVPAEPKFDDQWWPGPSFEQWLAATPPAPGDWKEEMRWHREFYPQLEDILNDLHRRGLIEAGKYGLHVWW